MGIMDSKVFQKYFIPGILFQSCVISGGYGTGREIIEFFMGYGPLGGMLAMGLVSLLSLSLLCAISFTFAQVFEKYNYKSFMQELMGMFWPVFEISYIIFIILVLAVVSATAGSVVAELFSISRWVGIIGMAVAVFFLVIRGSECIEKVLSIWSFVLYGVYFLFLILIIAQYGEDMLFNFQQIPIHGNWIRGGLQHAFYNLGIIIAVLYTIRHCDTPKEAFWAGGIAGVMGMLPGIMLFGAMSGFYPQILEQELPINYILNEMNMPWLQYMYQIVLFGTLVETASGLIYAVIDRIETAFRMRGRNIPKFASPIAVVLLLFVSVSISTFGLSNLIAKGYGTLAWVFLIVYILPLLTIGIYKIFKAKKNVV